MSALQAIAELNRLADPFRFDVPRSHRGLAGVGITAAKRAFVRTLQPMHIETLRPQRAFNVAVTELLGVIATAGIWRNPDAPGWIRSVLDARANPDAWNVQSHRGSLLGEAVGLTKTTWLAALEPILKNVLDAQRRFNHAAIDCLCDYALCRLRPSDGPLARLATLANPLSALPGSAARPLWHEVFRAQLAFNEELVQSLTRLSAFQPEDRPFFPTLSVIAANAEAGTLLEFLLSIATQGYPAAFEAIVPVAADDRALDAAARAAMRRYAWVRCVPALAEAFRGVQGDVVIFTDARRVLSPTFLEAHARPYVASERNDAVTCPLPADGAADDASRLFDALTPSSFVNFGTGAFSVKASFAEAIADQTHPIEAGYALYQRGARVVHAAEATSVRLKPSCEERAVEGFLHRHPEAGWVVENARSAPQRKVRPATKRLRILTYRWHCAHQYELFKLPHDFTLMMGAPQVSREWDFSVRPLRDNANLVDREKLRLDDFDLAILPFDESSVDPSLSNGVLPQDWGALFRELRRELRIPVIGLCHGTVPFHGQFDVRHERPDLVIAPNEAARRQLVDFVGDMPVVCNSHQANAEWQFTNSRVIWHGFDPAEYPRTRATRGAITITPGISRRPHYCGYYLFEKATAGVECDVLGDDMPRSVKVPRPPHVPVERNVFAHQRFRNYVDLIREYSVFFNPTLLSPMPRCRAEAMLCGLALVTTPNHDASMFVRDGVNGFCSSDPAEIRERLKYLTANREAARKLGDAGRETAVREFHIDRYLAEWRELIAKVVG